MTQRRRVLTNLLVASYVLTVTTSSLFHNHCLVGPESNHGHHCAGSCDHDNRPIDSPDQHRAGAHLSGTLGAIEDRAAEGENCPVCEFLAQKPILVGVVQAVASTPLQQGLVFSAAIRLSDIFAPFWQSRAPPAVA